MSLGTYRQHNGGIKAAAFAVGFTELLDSKAH
jgi:hypothetical protein